MVHCRWPPAENCSWVVALWERSLFLASSGCLQTGEAWAPNSVAKCTWQSLQVQGDICVPLIPSWWAWQAQLPRLQSCAVRHQPSCVPALSKQGDCSHTNLLVTCTNGQGDNVNIGQDCNSNLSKIWLILDILTSNSGVGCSKTI